MIAAVALVPLAAACGDGGTADAELPPGSSVPAATTPAAVTRTPQDPVLAAYLRFWDAVVAAHQAADPAYRGLTATAADPELSRVRTTVERNRIQKLSLRGRVTHEPGPAAVSGTTATLEDCYDISGWDPVLTSGERVDAGESGGTGRHRARYTLRRSGTSWLVADHELLGGC